MHLHIAIIVTKFVFVNALPHAPTKIADDTYIKFTVILNSLSADGKTSTSSEYSPLPTLVSAWIWASITSYNTFAPTMEEKALTCILTFSEVVIFHLFLQVSHEMVVLL